MSSSYQNAHIFPPDLPVTRGVSSTLSHIFLILIVWSDDFGQTFFQPSRRMCPSFWTCWWTKSGKPINLIDKHPKYPKTTWLVSTIPQHLCMQHISNPPPELKSWYLLEGPLVANDCQSLVKHQSFPVGDNWWTADRDFTARNAKIPGAKMCRFPSWCFLGSLQVFGRFANILVEFLWIWLSYRLSYYFTKKHGTPLKSNFIWSNFCPKLSQVGARSYPSWYCMLLLLLPRLLLYL